MATPVPTGNIACWNKRKGKVKRDQGFWGGKRDRAILGNFLAGTIDE
jgi:hypothetical protein